MPNDNPVAIFWDYENCSPSSSLSGHDIANQICRLAHDFGCVTTFRAYLDLSEQSNKSIHLCSQLQSSAISLIDRPHNERKDVAVKLILADMMAFAIDHPAPATVVLISGDHDYAYAVSILRQRRYSVVLVVPSHVHTSLKSQASKVFDWHNDVLRPVLSETLQRGAQADMRLVDYTRSFTDAQPSQPISSANTRLFPDLPQVGGINALESGQRPHVPQLPLSFPVRLNSEMAYETSDGLSSPSIIVKPLPCVRSPDFPSSTIQLASPGEEILDRSFTDVTPSVKRFDVPVNAGVERTGQKSRIRHTVTPSGQNAVTSPCSIDMHSCKGGALSTGIRLTATAPDFISNPLSPKSTEAVVAWRSNIPETVVTKPMPIPVSSKPVLPQTKSASNGVGKSSKSKTSLLVNGNAKSQPGSKKPSFGSLSTKSLSLMVSSNSSSAALVDPTKQVTSSPSPVPKSPVDSPLSRPGNPIVPPPPSIPPIFHTLIDQLGKFFSCGTQTVLRSKLGQLLVTLDQDIYKKAGVVSFTEYIALAQEEGMVVLGGSGGRAWVALAPKFMKD